MNLVISKCVTAVKVSNFTGDYLPNRSTLDIGDLGFFGIVSHKEHPPEVWSVPPVTPCIYIYVYKGKVTIQQATKAQRGSRGITILFLYLGTI